jgi:hypothetical protein
MMHFIMLSCRGHDHADAVENDVPAPPDRWAESLVLALRFGVGPEAARVGVGYLLLELQALPPERWPEVMGFMGCWGDASTAICESS